jgi:hypothetical protein
MFSGSNPMRLREWSRGDNAGLLPTTSCASDLDEYEMLVQVTEGGTEG